MKRFKEHQLFTYFKDNRYIKELQDKYLQALASIEPIDKLEFDYVLNTDKKTKVIYCSKQYFSFYDDLLKSHNSDLSRRGIKPLKVILRYNQYMTGQGFGLVKDNIDCFTEEENEYLLYNFGFDGLVLDTGFKLQIWGNNINYLKEQFNVDAVPNEIKAEKLIGETSLFYHLKYRSSQFFLYKSGCEDLYKKLYKHIDIDVDMLNNMCTWDEWVEKGYSLKEHQVDGIKFILKNKKGCIFDTTGVGKSMQAICAAVVARPKKVLIVTIANDKVKWQRVCDWFGFSSTILEGGEKNNDLYLNDSDVTIMNYDLFGYLDKKSKFLKRQFDFIIVDECHKVKEYSTKQSKAVREICNAPWVNYVVGLTATPIENNENVFHVFRNLGISLPNLIPSNEVGFGTFNAMFTSFLRDYCGMYEIVKNGNTIQVRGDNTKTEELCNYIKSKYIRRTHKDVEGFPKKTIFPIYIEMDGRQKKEYEAIIKGVKDEIKNDDKYKGQKGIQQLVENSRLRQFMAMEAITPSLNYIKSKVEDGHRFIVFTHFKEEFDEFKRQLKEAGIKGLWVNANKQKTFEKRDNFEIVDLFNSDHSYSVILGNIETLGTAHNIPTAMYGLVNSPDWANRNHEQGEGRNWRINRIGDVVTVYPIFLDTIVEDVFKRAEGKKNNANVLFGNED